jgi:hypothetical protein
MFGRMSTIFISPLIDIMHRICYKKKHLLSLVKGIRNSIEVLVFCYIGCKIGFLYKDRKSYTLGLPISILIEYISRVTQNILHLINHLITNSLILL